MVGELLHFQKGVLVDDLVEGLVKRAQEYILQGFVDVRYAPAIQLMVEPPEVTHFVVLDFVDVQEDLLLIAAEFDVEATLDNVLAFADEP
jgi:hypothetical protein